MIITVCIGSSCHLKGSQKVVEGLQKLLSSHALTDKVVMKGQFCMGNCMSGVCVAIDGENFSVRPDTVESFFSREILPRLA